MRRSRSFVALRRASTSAPVDSMTAAVIHYSSHAAGWTGVSAEEGRVPSWEVRDVTAPFLALSLNTAAAPLHLERRGDGGRFRSAVIPAGAIWLQPPGEVFSHLVPGPVHYGLVTLDPRRVAEAAGLDRLALAPAYDLEDPRLVGPVRALLAEAEGGAKAGAFYADCLRAAIGAFLASAGRGAPRELRREPARLDGRAIHQLRDYLAASFREGPSLGDMARRVGVSESQLLRAFRRTTGETPHAYLMRLRLEAVRDRLQRGRGTLAEIAAELGFADQSHMTRLFRRRFGLTPGAFRRGA
ncbi:MAG: AraC family transcriptional regulator [Anaeromyxobacter sp.]